MSTNVSLDIEELVVFGVGRAAARRLGSSLEAELCRLIEGRGLPARLRAPGGESPSLSLADLRVDAAAAPERAGRELAATLYRELDR